MMLAYQPIRSLATINMAAYQGATAFKRVSSVIDKKLIYRTLTQIQISYLKIQTFYLKILVLIMKKLKIKLLKILT